MLKTMVVTELTDRIFADAALLWELSGVGNPARGDDFDAVARTLANGGRLIMLYEADTPLGTVWLTHDHRRMYIHHMAVHPQHQNQGHGKLLMQEAMDYAAELGLQAKLEVKATNLSANQLYSHYGFEALDGYRLLIKRGV
jgi:ribosomal protein S18 acetylase RimI-like enzyme